MICKPIRYMQTLNPFRLLILLLSLSVLGLFPFGAFAKGKTAEFGARTAPAKVVAVADKEVREEIRKHLGVRYRKGGSSRKGMDCSGFVRTVYRDLFGVDLPHSAYYQFRLPTFKGIPLEELRTGDLIFFSPSMKKRRVSHVGIYLPEGRFAHACRGKGVTISSLNRHHWKSKIYSVKRMIGLEVWEAKDVETSLVRLAYVLDENSAFTLDFGSREMCLQGLGTGHMAPGDLSADRTLNLQFGFAGAPLQNPSWNIHIQAFCERRFPGVDVLQPAFPGATEANGGEGRISALPLYGQGVTFASPLRPSDWLRLTPYLSCFDYEQETGEKDLSGHSIGMDIRVGPQSDDWSLSTALQYSPGLHGHYGVSEKGDEQNALDLALVYRHRLTRHSHLLLTGSQVQWTGTNPNAPSREEDGKDRQFSLMFDFRY
ncbi:MAG: C40 family peptidase [Deltaproteobacteria bacterium]|nr:C40 family peptidase [Deltaproteobacteria bacterium]